MITAITYFVVIESWMQSRFDKTDIERKRRFSGGAEMYSVTQTGD
jgi:hypothetical protein